MASINWLSALSDVLVSNATVSEPGLTGWWSMNTVSEYPTGTATYFQDAWATVDGWTGGSGATIMASGGFLIATRAATEVVAQKSIPGISGSTIKYKVVYDPKITGFQWFDGSVLRTDGITWVRNGDYYIVNFVQTYVAGTTTYLRALYSDTLSHDFKVDWIYIGDGSYAANSLLDNSGNGNHGQIFGATPTAGVSGNTLSGDGVNDEVVGPVIEPLGAVGFWYKGTDSGLTDTGISRKSFVGFSTTTTAVKIVASLLNTGVVRIRWNDASAASQTATGTKIVNDGQWHHIVFWHTGSAVYLYVDGVLEASNTSTSLTSTASLNVRLFHYASGATGWLSGTIDEPRIYNRALSAAEVLYLYQNPSPYAALPNAPLQDGYSETKQNGVIRSSVDAGAPKMRQRFTAVTRQYNVSFALTSNMAQILDYFYYTTTSQGVALFNWTDPRTGASVEARFIEPPVHRPNGPEYVTSCTLEVLP